MEQKVAVYCRVSDISQNDSIQNQLATINRHYTQQEIYNMIQQIKVLDNKLTVTININGITFTEELEY